MPAKHQRRSNPVAMAEVVLDLLDTVPGDRVVFLVYKSRNGSLLLDTYKVNDVEPDRLRVTPNVYEVGTYRRGVSKSVIVDDLIEVMGRV